MLVGPMPPEVKTRSKPRAAAATDSAMTSIASGMTYAMTLTPGLAGVTFGNLPGGQPFIVMDL